MLTIEYPEVMNFEAAIRGMRNPMNSWEKSDSLWCNDIDCAAFCHRYNSEECPRCDKLSGVFFCIGPADLALAKKLARAGTDHRKFMRQILVSMDITAPLYWWKEFDTYKVGTVANSCSTMHTIHKRDLTRDDFSCEDLDIDELLEFDDIIDSINYNRSQYIGSGDKKYWRQIIQLLPSSYNQRRTVTLNYEVLMNIYHARRNHKLSEWHTFCEFIETLPYAELITGGDQL